MNSKYNQTDLLAHISPNRFLSAVVNPGEMIGVVAAQSIGEPATQVGKKCLCEYWYYHSQSGRPIQLTLFFLAFFR